MASSPTAETRPAPADVAPGAHRAVEERLGVRQALVGGQERAAVGALRNRHASTVCRSITRFGLELRLLARARRRAWQHRGVVSLIYVIVRHLLGLFMLLVRNDASKEAALLVLRHENAVLRRQARRIRYQPADRPHTPGRA